MPSLSPISVSVMPQRSSRRYQSALLRARRETSRPSTIPTCRSATRNWLDPVANPRVHATTQRVVNEAFADEKPHLKTLPLAPYRAVLKLERRVSHEGMVSIGGNLYSVPDTARRRILDVHVFADEIRIFENGALPLEGRDQTRLDPAHRKASAPARRRPSDDKSIVLRRAG